MARLRATLAWLRDVAVDLHAALGVVGWLAVALFFACIGAPLRVEQRMAMTVTVALILASILFARTATTWAENVRRAANRRWLAAEEENERLKLSNEAGARENTRLGNERDAYAIQVQEYRTEGKKQADLILGLRKELADKDKRIALLTAALRQKESGQGLVEYMAITMAAVIVLIGFVGLRGLPVRDWLTHMADAFH